MSLSKNRDNRVLRGGCYDRITGNLRVSSRFGNLEVFRNWNYGFRFVIRGQK